MDLLLSWTQWEIFGSRRFRLHLHRLESLCHPFEAPQKPCWPRKTGLWPFQNPQDRQTGLGQ